MSSALSDETLRHRLISGIVFLGVLLALVFILYEYLSLDFLKSQHQIAVAYYKSNPVIVITSFYLLYTLYASLALPGVNLIMLLTGAVFGFWIGTIGTAICSTIGAVAIFLWSRYFFSNFLQKKLQRQSDIVNKNINLHGPYYIFFAHTLLGIPSNIICMVFGLTRLTLMQFFIPIFAVQILAATVYNYIGATIGLYFTRTELIDSKLIFVIPVLAVLPVLAIYLYLKEKNTLKAAENTDKTS